MMEEGDPLVAVALDWHMRLRASHDDAVVRREFEAWLAADGANARAFAMAEEVWRLTGMAKPANVHVLPPRRRIPAIAAMGIAAMLLVFLLPDVWIFLRADHRTGVGETREIKLPDGTKLALAPQSAVDVRYNDGQRSVVLLKGQSYFDVAADPARAFSVTAGDAVISDIGTAFNVALTAESVDVSVEEGVVLVRRAEDSSAERIDERLVAGERLALNLASDGGLTRYRISPAHVASWRHNRLIVENATVAEVADELNRYRQGFVVIPSDALGNRRVSGMYDTRNPERALQSLLSPFHGEVTYLTPYIAILSAR